MTNNKFHSDRLPKLVGADVELGNFITGLQNQPRDGTGREASRLLLREVPGSSQTTKGRSSKQCDCESCRQRRREQSGSDYYSGQYGSGKSGGKSSGGYDPQDWGRKYLASNGGCIYIDLDHLELCIPEVTSARDYTAAWHAMLRIARDAQIGVSSKLESGLGIQVLANCSDGLGNSYGSHLSFLLNRRAWENIFHRKLHHMLFLAAYQCSSIVFTGQGKAGGENETRHVDYQISQRADFFETLTGVQTTYRRPIVNSRDETLCGRQSHNGYSSFDKPDHAEMARLHVIFYDSTLCHVATMLKVGVMQIVLAMIEADRIDPTLILDDPLEALSAWSRDPSLEATARTAGGERLTAVAVQRRFLAQAERFHADGGLDGVVPHADEILTLWDETLAMLAARDFDALAGRLDWVLKYRILDRAIRQRPGLAWNSPEVKHLDHLYSSIDPDDGLYLAYEKAGVVERLVEDAEIERFVHEPPEDTRAWTRAMLLRAAGPERVDHVNWDYIRFRLRSNRGWSTYPTLDLDNPLAATREEMCYLFESDLPLEDILERIEDSTASHEPDEDENDVDAEDALNAWLDGEGNSDPENTEAELDDSEEPREPVALLNGPTGEAS